MILANIIHENELVTHDKVDYVNYINNSLEYELVDKSIPTLYVGWRFMKRCNESSDIINNASILNSEIIPNRLYWEFGFNENKQSHVNGINLFINNIPKYYFESEYNYVNVDPIFLKFDNAEGLLGKLPIVIDSLYNYKNEMLYALTENEIYGINIEMLKFFGFQIDGIIESVYAKANVLHMDLDGNGYNYYRKIMPKYQLLKRYIVTILSK